MHKALAARRGDLKALLVALDALSPLQVLLRGYAVVRDAQGHVVQSVSALAAGQAVVVRLSDGAVRATIDEVRPDPPATPAGASGGAGPPEVEVEGEGDGKSRGGAA